MIVSVDYTANGDCDTGAGEICCPVKLVCEVPVSAGACGESRRISLRIQRACLFGVNRRETRR